MGRCVCRILLPALGALLGGCATSLPAPIQTASETRLVAPEEAFALPTPGGPAVMTILERHYANAVEQEIIFVSSSERPGQNFLRVQLFGRPVSRSADHATLENALPEMGAIWLEMDEHLEGVGMVVSPYYVENRYGPFGYAMGRYADDLCLYAWQRIGDTGTSVLASEDDAAIGVRLRLCRTGVSERQLLEAMYDFTINAYYADGYWDPFRDSVRLASGDAIYPPDDVLDPAPAPAPVAPTPAPTPVLEPTGPAVPPPPGGGTSGPIVPPPPG